MKRFFLLLALLSLATTANATTWFVEKGGSGVNCSQYQSSSTPSSTISAAMACAISAGGAGNTVEIRDSSAAVYAESVSSWPSATAGNHFTLKATNPNIVTLRPGSGTHVLD